MIGPDGRELDRRTARHRPVIAVALFLTGLGFVGGGAVFSPQVIRILGDRGQLVIETSDPKVEVEVKQDGRSVTIVDTATNRRIDLKAGDYDLDLAERGDGLRLSTQHFSLIKGRAGDRSREQRGRTGGEPAQ